MGNNSTKTIEIPINSPANKSPPRPLHQPQYSSASRPATILAKPMSDVTSYYVLDKELDRGQFDITYLCTKKATGLNFARKSISKNKLTRRGDKEIVKREILIMQHLSGQPNIVKHKATFEDQRNIHLIMELCSGGTLSDRITLKGSCPERAAAAIGRAIVNVVCACHFMGVMHRDLKPESFLFSTRNEDALLKVTSFRHSVFVKEG